MSKEIFERLKRDSNNYCLIIGWVDIHKDEDGTFYMQENIKENEYLQKVGCFPDDMIRDAIANHEWKVDKEGMYEFMALLCTESNEYGDYGQTETYLYVDYIETKFLITFEEREVQEKASSELVDYFNKNIGNDLF